MLLQALEDAEDFLTVKKLLDLFFKYLALTNLANGRIKTFHPYLAKKVALVSSILRIPKLPSYFARQNLSQDIV